MIKWYDKEIDSGLKDFSGLKDILGSLDPLRSSIISNVSLF
jgi:hypothetical protein